MEGQTGIVSAYMVTTNYTLSCSSPINMPSHRFSLHFSASSPDYRKQRPVFLQMKKTGLYAASVAAASATVLSGSTISSSSNPIFLRKTSISISQQEERNRKGENSSPERSDSTDNKFAPRFDGLKFIETLVTAHR